MTTTTIDANVAAATRRLSHFINRCTAQQKRRMLAEWAARDAVAQLERVACVSTNTTSTNATRTPHERY